jgi:hypothetical protein
MRPDADAITCHPTINFFWKTDNLAVAKDVICLILQGQKQKSNDVSTKWLHQLQTNSKDVTYI